jgi:hypothetical protein
MRLSRIGQAYSLALNLERAFDRWRTARSEHLSKLPDVVLRFGTLAANRATSSTANGLLQRKKRE